MKGFLFSLREEGENNSPHNNCIFSFNNNELKSFKKSFPKVYIKKLNNRKKISSLFEYLLKELTLPNRFLKRVLFADKKVNFYYQNIIKLFTIEFQSKNHQKLSKYFSSLLEYLSTHTHITRTRRASKTSPFFYHNKSINSNPSPSFIDTS